MSKVHNPNHPMTRAMEGQWHKIVALILAKYHPGETLEFTITDVLDLDRRDQTVVIKDSAESETIRVWLVSNKEAEILAREEGGLPA